MGLNRCFTIYAENRDSSLMEKEKKAAIRKAIEGRYCGWTGDIECGLEIDGVNWLDFDEDMQSLAMQFPDVVFNLFCYGSSLDDIFNACYCEDRSDIQFAEIPEVDYDFVKGNKNKEE